MAIYLAERALTSIIKSCSAHYRQEAFGYLHGNKEGDNVTLTDATDVPRVWRRTPNMVDVGRSWKTQHTMFEAIAGPIIGDYHSHTESRHVRPSAGYSINERAEDLESMLCRPDEVYVIVAVHDLCRRVPWREKKNGELAGGVAGRYFKIAAFLLDKPLWDAAAQRNGGTVEKDGLTVAEQKGIFRRCPIVLENVV